MKSSTSRTFGSRQSAWLLALAFLCQLAPVAARAATNTITDGNSSVSVNTTSQAGMFNWSVDGQNMLNQQWFWFRLGPSGPQLSLDTLGAPVVIQSPGMLDLTYTSAGSFTIQTVFTLSGGASGGGNSGMGEQIKITDISGSTLAFHFFQYADFNLPGNASLKKNVAGTLFNNALVKSGNISLSEDIDTSVAPGANHGEAELFNSTLNNLNLTSGYTMNDNTNAGSGTDHVTWGFEWDQSITNGGSFTISKVLSIEGVPEPQAWSLLSMGAIAFGILSVFRKRGK